MPKPWLLLLCLLLAGCDRESRSTDNEALRNDEMDQAGTGAVSTAPVVVELPAASEPAKSSPPPPATIAPVDWSPLEMTAGSFGFSCSLDYQLVEQTALTAFDATALREALATCAEPRLMRISFRGRIDRASTAGIERLINIADELGIDKRVLDIDSAGGQVEEAIRAGDLIAESRWTIWVREGSICHSACVLILGAGDKRMIAGEVGIHRIIRMSSTARTRAELNAELNVVYERVRSYLERNGVATAVADLMMAVPNRRLRVLTGDELTLYGLDGVNPVQDDLDRLRLLRKCGEDFLRRRDAFLRIYERSCNAASGEIDALKQCGLELRERFGFPDAACSDESPMSEFDIAAAVRKTRKPPPAPEVEDTSQAEAVAPSS